ncbi:MAG: hypothetical protein ACLFRD_10585, partial [Nitriliruptoraceae bacterium]
IGALRILRIRRILKAGQILRERAGITEGWQRAVTVAMTLLAAAFVSVVLADPTSRSREWLDQVVATVGWPGVVVAGLIIAGATYIVRANRDDESDEKDEQAAVESSAVNAPTAHEPRATR